MHIKDLPTRSIQTVRLGRAGLSCIAWGPWHEAEVYTGRREMSIKRGRHVFPRGVCTVTADGTADFNPQHDYVSPESGFPWGYFMCEDWCMEIKGLEPEWRL